MPYGLCLAIQKCLSFPPSLGVVFTSRSVRVLLKGQVGHSFRVKLESKIYLHFHMVVPAVEMPPSKAFFANHEGVLIDRALKK